MPSDTRCPYCDKSFKYPLQLRRVSPFSNIIRTNDATFEKHKIENVRNYIADTERDLNLLEAKCAELRQSIQEHTALLSSIRIFPPEIMAKIFTFYCLPDVGYIGNTKWVHRRGPWTLAQVCRYWRSVSLTAPELWSNIHLKLGQDHSSAEIDTVRIFTSIQRSAAHPLHVQITSPSKTATHPVLSTLLSHSQRWEELSLVTDADYTQPHILTTVLSARKDHFDTLHSLHWYLREKEGISDSIRRNVKRMVAFENAPRLDTLNLDGVPQAYRMQIPWSQLTRLSLTYEDADGRDPLRILVNTPNLEECTLAFDFIKRPKADTPITTLRSLHSLNITRSYSLMTGVLNHLRTPALTSLNVSEVRDVDSLITFIRSSKCTLSELTVNESFLYDHDLLPLLDETPLLRKLSVEWCNLCIMLPNRGRVSNELLRALTYSLDGSRFRSSLPSLEYLTLRKVCHLDGPLFVSMVESRVDPELVGGQRPSGTRRQLRSISLSCSLGAWPTGISQDDLDKLQNLRRMGLVVNAPSEACASLPE